MKYTIAELKKLVIDNGYCVGCGVCALYSENIKMELNDNEEYQAVVNEHDNSLYENICPFLTDVTEDDISNHLYKNVNNIKYNKYVGYYIENYAGYVRDSDSRINSSSGGMTTWMLAVLIKNSYVDEIIHVKKNSGNGLGYSFQVSTDLTQIYSNTKSQYYPVEMSKILKYIRESDKRFAIVGVPCFIKSLRLLQQNEVKYKEKILFLIGLVCGHLKSAFYSKSLSWQIGIEPNSMSRVDFRIKYPNQTADNYGIEVYSKNNIIKSHPSSRSLFGTNWGQGLFKYKACDYCDDVYAETADITFGDAWLPKYTSDGLGTNLIIVRNPKLMDIITKHSDQIHIETLQIDDVKKTQYGGIRHKNEGLAYRLYLDHKNNKWVPTKRVHPSKNLTTKRKKIYWSRTILREKSFTFFKEALEKNDYHIYESQMRKYIDKYKRFYRPNILLRVIKKMRRFVVAWKGKLRK